MRHAVDEGHGAGCVRRPRGAVATREPGEGHGSGWTGAGDSCLVMHCGAQGDRGHTSGRDVRGRIPAVDHCLGRGAGPFHVCIRACHGIAIMKNDRRQWLVGRGGRAAIALNRADEVRQGPQSWDVGLCDVVRSRRDNECLAVRQCRIVVVIQGEVARWRSGSCDVEREVLSIVGDGVLDDGDGAQLGSRQACIWLSRCPTATPSIAASATWYGEPSMLPAPFPMPQLAPEATCAPNQMATPHVPAFGPVVGHIGPELAPERKGDRGLAVAGVGAAPTVGVVTLPTLAAPRTMN